MSRRQLMQMLFDEYAELYLGRDPRLLEHFSHDFSGYTGCGDFLVQDVSQWHEITRLDFSQVPEPIRWEMQDIAFQDLADTVIAVTAFFHIHLPVPDAILASETARLVLIFRQEADGWKVAHSGISLPYRVAAQAGEVYPLEDLHNRNLRLEALIESRTRELEEANRRLEKLSRMDGLTGIANRRTFDLTLKQEWRRAQRRQRPLSLVMLDVDHFKSYNDGYGHLVGDEVLITLARILAQQARRGGDLAARYGGEEFVLLLPDCLEPAARQVAENVRTALHEQVLPHHGSPWGIVTVSLGVACRRPGRPVLPSCKLLMLRFIRPSKPGVTASGKWRWRRAEQPRHPWVPTPRNDDGRAFFDAASASVTIGYFEFPTCRRAAYRKADGCRRSRRYGCSVQASIRLPSPVHEF